MTDDVFPSSTNDKPNFPDQCAIRLGTSLALSGIDTRSLNIRHCWFHDSSKGHVLSADELAMALVKRKPPTIGNLQKIHPENFQCNLRSRSGILYFKDFWLRTGETIDGRTGDHIDLWDGNRLTKWRTWLTISCWFGVREKYPRSREIWFCPFLEQIVRFDWGYYRRYHR